MFEIKLKIMKLESSIEIGTLIRKITKCAWKKLYYASSGSNPKLTVFGKSERPIGLNLFVQKKLRVEG